MLRIFGQTETIKWDRHNDRRALIAGRSLETAEGVLGSVEVRTLWFQPDHEALSAPKLYGRNPAEELCLFDSLSIIRTNQRLEACKMAVLINEVGAIFRHVILRRGRGRGGLLHPSGKPVCAVLRMVAR
jgi:hypothetical protein